MRYFVRSFYSKRRAQATVIKDTEKRQFEVTLWLAADGLQPKVIAVYGYPLGKPGLCDRARTAALTCAAKTAELQDGLLKAERDPE